MLVAYIYFTTRQKWAQALKKKICGKWKLLSKLVHYDRSEAEKSPKWIFYKKRQNRPTPWKIYGKWKLLSKLEQYDRTTSEKSPKWIFTKKKGKMDPAPKMVFVTPHKMGPGPKIELCHTRQNGPSPKNGFCHTRQNGPQSMKQKTYRKWKLLSKVEQYNRTEVEKSPEWIFVLF